MHHTVSQETEGGCEFTEWSSYGPCSVTCGEGGRKVKVRRLISVDSNVDVVNCTGRLTEFKPCDASPCEGKHGFCMNVGWDA